MLIKNVAKVQLLLESCNFLEYNPKIYIIFLKYNPQIQTTLVAYYPKISSFR
mgnify:CR=1 FL=1